MDWITNVLIFILCRLCLNVALSTDFAQYAQELPTLPLLVRSGRVKAFYLAFSELTTLALSHVQNFAQQLVHADRASLFLVDTHKRELYARIFDVGVTGKDLLDECSSFEAKDASTKSVHGPALHEIRLPILAFSPLHSLEMQAAFFSSLNFINCHSYSLRFCSFELPAVSFNT